MGGCWFLLRCTSRLSYGDKGLFEGNILCLGCSSIDLQVNPPLLALRDPTAGVTAVSDPYDQPHNSAAGAGLLQVGLSDDDHLCLVNRPGW
jgi:hypothetical protein